MTNLFITDHGDESVGIFSQSFIIETQFENCEDDKEELEWFRNAQIEIYKEYASGKVTAEYDFERAEILKKELIDCLKP
jgi:hypothetical protein